MFIRKVIYIMGIYATVKLITNVIDQHKNCNKVAPELKKKAMQNYYETIFVD